MPGQGWGEQQCGMGGIKIHPKAECGGGRLFISKVFCSDLRTNYLSNQVVINSGSQLG